MAEKKSKVKAHTGFIHMRKPAGPADGGLRRRRPTGDSAPQMRITPRRQKRTRSQSELQAMSDAQLKRYFNRQIKQNVRQKLSPAARRRLIKQMRQANLTPQQRKAELVKFDRMQSNLRKGLDFQGRPIPRGKDQVSRFRQQMKNMPKEQKQLMEMSQRVESKAQKDLRQKALEQQLRAQAKNVATQRTGVSPAQRKQMVASAQRTPPMTPARRAQVMRSMLRPNITPSGMGVERVYSDAEIARATQAQGKAKGGAVFKEKDYVNLSNIKDNLKKK